MESEHTDRDSELVSDVSAMLEGKPIGESLNAMIAIIIGIIEASPKKEGAIIRTAVIKALR